MKLVKSIVNKLLNADSESVTDFFCNNADKEEYIELFEEIAKCILNNLPQVPAGNVFDCYADADGIGTGNLPSYAGEFFTRFIKELDTEVLFIELAEREELPDAVEKDGIDLHGMIDTLCREYDHETVSESLAKWKKLNLVDYQ